MRDFDARQIAKRRSEELRREFIRFTRPRWQTITKYGNEMEVAEAGENFKGKGNAAKRARA